MTAPRAASGSVGPSRPFSRERSSLARIPRAFLRGLELFRAIVLEFQRATVAAHRFEELKHATPGGNNPAAHAFS